MGTNRDFGYVRGLFDAFEIQDDNEAPGFQHRTGSQVRPKAVSKPGVRGSGRSCSDVSMQNNIAEEPQHRLLSRNTTFSSDSHSLNFNNLQLGNEIIASRKRPAEQDVKPSGLSEQFNPAHKLSRTGSGAFDRASQLTRTSRLSPKAICPSTCVNASSSPNACRQAEHRSHSHSSSAVRGPGPLNSRVGPHDTSTRPKYDQQRMRAVEPMLQHSHVSRQRRAAPAKMAEATSDKVSIHSRVRQQSSVDVNPATFEHDEEPVANTCLISQPHSRPIPNELLQKEVESIRAVVDQVEEKCSGKVREEVEKLKQRRQRNEPQPDLDRQFWQSMVGIHRVLLHEMHDFFLASSHPTAPERIKSKATRVAMPARMWKFGIHDFLELLRSLLPLSLEYMLSFLSLAYQIIALLYETVPSFQETWMECLGDLARYRMAIEEQDRDLRENWTEVARYWYSKVIDSSPKTGRLHHHIAILSRHYALQQLSSYKRSLTALQPFAKTQESVMHLYRPILARNASQPCKNIDEQFIKLHGLMFTQKAASEDFDKDLAAFLIALKPSISSLRKKWRESGSLMAVCNNAALLGYESTRQEQGAPNRPGSSAVPQRDLSFARSLVFGTLDVILRLTNDENVIAHVHLVLVFLWRLVCSPVDDLPISKADRDIFVQEFPFVSLCKFLNHQLGRSTGFKVTTHHKVVSSFEYPSPRTASGAIQVLEEDYLLREQAWSIGYLPEDWYPDVNYMADAQNAATTPNFARPPQAVAQPRSTFDLSFYDDMGHVRETSQSPGIRVERVMHLAKRIVACRPQGTTFENGTAVGQQWIHFEPRKNRFELVSTDSAPPTKMKREVDVKIEDDDSRPLIDLYGQGDMDVKMEDLIQ